MRSRRSCSCSTFKGHCYSMQEEATACNAEKLAALSTIAKLDKQICEARDSMTKLLAARDRSCSNDVQALRAECSRLKVC